MSTSSPSVNLFRRSIISTDQFTRDDVDEIFRVARVLKHDADQLAPSRLLSGRILGSLFFEASTRTRMSFSAAFMRLGGQVNPLNDVSESSRTKGESLLDTVRVAQYYCDVLVLRDMQSGSARLAAENIRVPVINAGDGDGEHPTQALIDAFTIEEECGAVEGKTILINGDIRFGRAVNSLTKLLALYRDVTVLLLAPPHLQMRAGAVRELEARGLNVVQTADFDRALEIADIIYCTRIQAERSAFGGDAAAGRDYFVVDRHTLEIRAKNSVVILHPMPRNFELAPDVDDLPNAAHFRQAQNGLYVRMALFEMMFGITDACDPNLIPRL